jgi:hypothetical protein
MHHSYDAEIWCWSLYTKNWKGNLILAHTTQFDQFPKYHMNILAGDFNAKVGVEDIFKPTIRIESLCEINDGNRATVVNFST